MHIRPAHVYHGSVILTAILVLFIRAAAQSSAATPSTQSSEAFVRGLYDRERHPTRADEEAFSGHQGAEAIYSHSLLALIRRDIRSTPKGEVGKLDFDPICGCQDADGLTVSELRATSLSSGRSDVRVVLHFDGSDTQRLTLHLLQTPAGWRVDDISTKEIASLRRFLTSS